MPVVRKTVIVRDQELLISIGVHPHEKIAPQRLIVNVEADLADTGDEMDEIGATLDYDKVHSFIKAQARLPHSLLQESVARRILAFVLAQKGVSSVVVETRKRDVFDDCAFVAVRIEARNPAMG